MHRAWLLCFVLVGIAFAAPLFASDHAAAVATSGTVQIVYPLSGATLGIAGTRVQLKVTNFILDPNSGPCLAADHGRIRLYLNDTFVQETSDTNTSFSQLLPTHTKLGAQLVCTDSSSFTPPVWHNITIKVGEPGIKILRPGSPVLVSTAGARIDYSVKNFSLDPADYAGPYVPGQGHVHVYRNGTILIGTSTAPYVDIASFPEGPSKLTVELHNNDHSLVTTSSHPFGYNDTVAALGVKPSIRILSPADKSQVSTNGFRIQVHVQGLDLSQDNYGGPVVPGQGHVHYYLADGPLQLLAATPSTYFDVGTLPAATHTIRVDLRNNDHSPLSPPVTASIMVTASGPSITLVSPANRSALSTVGTRISVRVAGFILDQADYGGTNVAGQGHVHYYLDNTTLLSATTSTYFDVPSLPSGTHTIRVDLRNNDHSPLSPAVFKWILVNVGAPELKILEPVDDATVSTLGVRLRFAVSNFTLDPPDYGGAAIPGQGHIHVYLGTSLLATPVVDHVVITGLSAGNVILRAELRNNDHSPLGTPVTATVDVAVAAPSITLSAPASISVGQDLDLTWTVTGFVLDSATFGGAPEPGRGHVHVFVDGTDVVQTADTNSTLTGLAAGPHTIEVVLYNNDHSTLATKFSDSATVTVSTAPPRAGTVDAAVFYGSAGILVFIIIALVALLAVKGRKGPPEKMKPEQVKVEK